MKSQPQDNRILLLFSSGLRTRYVEDIPRALGEPYGAHLRFRYRKKHIPDGLFQQLADASLKGTTTLVVYVDATEKGKGPFFVPCRFGRLETTLCLGDIVVLIFELTDYAYGPNGPAFASELQVQATDAPHWEGDTLKGTFCSLLGHAPQTCERTVDIDKWQKIVAQIKERGDFRDEPFFYKVDGLFRPGSGSPEHPQGGIYKLKANVDYEFRIAHYIPENVNVPTQTVKERRWIMVEIPGESTQVLTQSRVAIDSPYDWNRVRFRVEGRSRRQYQLASFYRIRNPGLSASIENALYDFDLPIEISSEQLKTILVSVGIGILLGLQQIVTLYKSQQLDWTGGALVVLVGIGAATVAAFGLRRPG